MRVRSRPSPWFAILPKSSPCPPPFGYGIIKLDGADTGMAHLLYGSDPAKWKIGMKVKAVFKENRSGSILDIAYFKPI